MILSSLLTLLKINVSYLEPYRTKHFITAIENIRFELYFRYISIQTYRILYFSRRLLAKHHTLSSWCRIFSGRYRSHKIRLLSTWKVFIYCCHGDIDFTKSCILTNNNSQSITSKNFVARIKSLLRRLKNIGMVSQKLYRNTLIVVTKNDVCFNVRGQPDKQD